MKRFFPLLLILILFLSGCGIKTVPEPAGRQPSIRVGLADNIESIEFSLGTGAEISSYDGSFITRGMRGKRWIASVKEGNPSKNAYLLVAASMSSRESAEKMALEIEARGFDTFIRPHGEIRKVGETVQDNRTYRIYIRKAFNNRDQAAAYQRSIAAKQETFIAEQPLTSASGKITFRNVENGQEFESSRPILIKGGNITLYEIPVGQGFHWEDRVTREYPETILFQVNKEGKLAVINSLPVETYLRGVVPSEMPSGFPLEALKAQAVAARGEALSKLGKAHKNDPYDICATVHCQVYSGVSKWAKETDRAVTETRGLVLWQDDEICRVVYSAVCGGHGEDNDKVWSGDPKNYLQGRYDGPASLKKYGSLQSPPNVRNWILDFPDSYCNSVTQRILPSMEYTRKYFRWKQALSQDDLQKSLGSAIGWTGGQIQDLIPLSRGVSGRIIQLQVKGSRSSQVIKGELAIRRALSPTTLWSSCFFVEKSGLSGDAPGTFTLHGAGWGHGVGMCQTGAAGMALEGKKFNEILAAYFNGPQLKRLY